MKNTQLLLSLMASIAMSNAALAAPSISYYGGIALAWDHLFGNRSESFIDFEGGSHTISNGRSLSNTKLNGYGFFGVSFAFDSIPLFISPEIQVGQGTMSAKINTTINQEELGVILPRAPNPEFSRNFTSSFAIRVGSHFNACYQLYVLGGVDISRFKYNYTWETIDLGEIKLASVETKYYTKWKTAPLFGFGMEKEVNKNFKVGLEFRMALYNNIKIDQLFAQDALSETATSTFKPKISSFMLRLSYVL